MATVSLTLLGFFLVQSKVHLVIGYQGKILAKSNPGDVFDYGEDGTEGHKHDARQWLSWTRIDAQWPASTGASMRGGAV
ncbi:hypothetical protein [Ramlibacter sp. 2FC]|uniref:hypothetical protein n=1 Tax=Ramlibacter sp. 2FC TaxID=2502188 RepID=UPI0010F7B260|nr:hypothetical protein [Ramlibacter sp. 2FC]